MGTRICCSTGIQKCIGICTVDRCYQHYSWFQSVCSLCILISSQAIICTIHTNLPLRSDCLKRFARSLVLEAGNIQFLKKLIAQEFSKNCRFAYTWSEFDLWVNVLFFVIIPSIYFIKLFKGVHTSARSAFGRRSTGWGIRNSSSACLLRHCLTMWSVMRSLFSLMKIKYCSWMSIISTRKFIIRL